MEKKKMRQGNQTKDGPFWAEHYSIPEKSGMIDASGWVIYVADPDTGEKITVGVEVCLPYSLSGYARERLQYLRKRLKRTSIEKMIMGDFFHRSTPNYVKTAKAIKKSLGTM